jgi:hypothetical protein
LTVKRATELYKLLSSSRPLSRERGGIFPSIRAVTQGLVHCNHSHLVSSHNKQGT